jgi:hypothetical protein
MEVNVALRAVLDLAEQATRSDEDVGGGGLVGTDPCYPLGTTGRRTAEGCAGSW